MKKAPPPPPPSGAKPAATRGPPPATPPARGKPSSRAKYEVQDDPYKDLSLPEVLPKNNSVFNYLPNTIWWRIFSKLNPKEAARITVVSRRFSLLARFQLEEVDLTVYNANELDVLLAGFQPPREKNVGSVFSKKVARVVVESDKPTDPMIDLMDFLSKTGGAHTIKLSSNATDEHVSHLKNPRALKNLSLDGCDQITDQGIASLPRNLVSLELNGVVKMTDSALQYISEFSRLENLSLASTNISDSGLQKHAPNFPKSLKILSLWNCTKVSDASIPTLPESVNNLSLRRTKITDTGLAKLNKKMNVLDLSGTKITDAGLASLPGSLNRLVLYYTPVTEAGVLKIPGLKGIFHLDIRNTKVKEDGAKKIQTILTTPDAELLHESVPPPAELQVHH